ncbi:MAG: DUF6165 family protein [Caulobacteraceae bacterium]
MVGQVEAPIAIGELIDKISILEIKSERLTDQAKLGNVRRELVLLQARRDAALPPSADLEHLAAQLKEVNTRIWDLEDVIRDCERRKDFGKVFLKAARAIYHTNDERAAVKRDINLVFGSAIVEEKSYAAY